MTVKGEEIVDIFISESADRLNLPNILFQEAKAAAEVCVALVNDEGMYSLISGLSIRWSRVVRVWESCVPNVKLPFANGNVR